MTEKKRRDHTIFSLLFVLCGLLITGAGRASARLPTAAGLDSLGPPFVKGWEFRSSDRLDHTLPLGHNRIAFATSTTWGVLDTRMGQLLWEKSIKRVMGENTAGVIAGVSLAFDGSQLFAFLETGRIDACDPKNGHSNWQISSNGDYPSSFVQRGKLITSIRPREICAIETTTHQVIWTCKVFPESVRPSGNFQRLQLVVEPARDIAVFCQGDWISAVNATSGKLLWRHSHTWAVDESGSGGHSALLIDPEHVYTFDAGGNIEALSLVSGASSGVAMNASPSDISSACRSVRGFLSL